MSELTDVSVTVTRTIDADGNPAISVSSTPNRGLEVMALLAFGQHVISKELYQ